MRVEVLDLLVAEDNPDLARRLLREDPNSARCPCGFQTVLDLPLLVRFSDGRDFFCPRTSSDESEDEADLRRLVRKLERRKVAVQDVRWGDRRLLCAILAGERRDDLLLLHKALNVDPGDDARRHERLCAKAIELVDSELTPLLWSRVAVNLADALADRGTADGSTAAVRLYTLAVEILPNGGTEWADTKLALAAALHDGGSPQPQPQPQELDACVTHVRDVLASPAARTYPEIAAIASQSLMNALVSRGRSKDSREALQAGRKAASYWRRCGDPYALALVLTDLADAHLGRQGASRVDASVAERLSREAQGLLEEGNRKHVQDWMRTVNLLATSLSHEMVFGWRDQMDESLRLLERALTSVGRREAPLYWARTASNLAEVYLFRGEGDRVENVERSVELFRDALSVRALRKSPNDLRSALLGLGIALSDRLRGDPIANHRSSVRALRGVLSLEAREGTDRESWANAAANLGVVLSKHPTDSGRKRHIEKAVSLLESARRVRADYERGEKVAFIDNNLGALYLERPRGVPEDNVRRAIELLESSVAFYSRRSPVMRARAMYNLGRAHEALALLKVDAGLNLAKAARAFRSALRVFDLEAFPHDRRGVARNLFNVEFQRGRLRSMKQAMAMAAEASRKMYGRAETPDGRAMEVDEDAYLFRVLIETDLSITPKDFVAAFEHSEEGRARLLTSEMSGVPPSVPAMIPIGLAELEATLVTDLRRVEREVAATEGTKHFDAVRRAEATRREVERVWAEIQNHPQGEAYVELRRGHGLSWARTQQWLSNQPLGTSLLEFSRVPEGLVSFFVRKGDSEPIVDRVDLTLEELRMLARHVDDEVHRFHKTWLATRDWNDLAARLLTPLMPYLKDVRLLYVSPSQELQGVPLHAVEVEGEPLVSRCALVYVSSVGVAARLPAEHGERRVTRSAVFGDPTGDRPFAEQEARTVGTLLDSPVSLGSDATVRAVREAFEDCDVLHFAGHGHFDSAEPMGSGLRCADGLLTAKSLATASRSPSLVVLSGCGTGRVGVRVGEEPYGLARALTTVGVRRTVLSLWDVDEEASRFFMEDFYRRLTPTTSVTEALRLAMLACRRQFEYAFLWAPWIQQGAA